MCCQYFSCIITKDFKVHWSKRTMAHEDLLAELKLEDKKLEERDFVKIEIAPKDVKKVSRNRDDWTFKVDEERTLPNWYDENVVKCQGACWKSVGRLGKKAYKSTLRSIRKKNMERTNCSLPMVLQRSKPLVLQRS